MKRGALLTICLLACLLGTGCSGTYWRNRGGDIAEIVDFSAGVCLYGESLRIPHFLVSVQVTRGAHLAIGNAVTARGGLVAGEISGWIESGSALPAAPFYYYGEGRGLTAVGEDKFWVYDFYDRWDYFLGLPSYYHDVWSPSLDDAFTAAKLDSPVHWFDVGVDLAPLIPAIRFRLSPGELLDFLVGFGGLDLAGDDLIPEENLADYLADLRRRSREGGHALRRDALLTAYQYRYREGAWEVFRDACNWDDVRDRGAMFFLLTRGRWSALDKLPILIDLQDDPDQRLRMAAMAELAQIGQVASVALPILIRTMESDRSASERGLAISVMADIALVSSIEDQDMVARAIGRCFLDENEVVRLNAQAALDALGSAAEAAIPYLIKALEAAESTEERLLAIRLLSRFGSRSSGAVPVLETLLGDDSIRVRNAARRALERIGP